MVPIEVIEGHSRIVNITAKSNPNKLSYTWLLYDGVKKYGKDQRNYDIYRDYQEPHVCLERTDLWQNGLDVKGMWVSGNVLNITRAFKYMAGTYQVKANNSEGTAMTVVKVDVLYPAR